MSRIDDPRDHDIVYTKTGTALTTSYTFGDDFSVGSNTRISLFVVLAEAAMGSSMSTAEVKLQVKDKAGNYYDVNTMLNDAGGGTVSNVQSLASTAGSTLYYLLQTDTIAPNISGCRIAAKSTGATASGDSLVVRAVSM